jgi:glucokinase
MGKQSGNANAAKEAFRQLGIVLGDVMGNLITVFDGAVVIGGGLSGAMSLILPAMQAELESKYTNYNGLTYPRLVQKVFNLNDQKMQAKFLDWKEMDLEVPGTNEIIKYSQESRIPIGISQIGTSRAISLGAYAYALNSLA